MLIRRARIWGALCAADREGRPAALSALLDDAPCESDGEQLIERMRVAGLVQVAHEEVQLSPRGRQMAARTLRDGELPHAVTYDAGDWRQRAWTAMRIHRRFTSVEIARVCGAPSRNRVQVLCRELARGGYLHELGFEARGPHRRLMGYQLARDPGPQLPRRLEGQQPANERSRDRSWPRRAWSALWRLSQGGRGASVQEVSRAARVEAHRVRTLVEELVAAGAVERPAQRGLPRGGREWLYVVRLDGRDRGEPVLAGAERPNGTAWRDAAWAMLQEAGELTAAQVGDACGVTAATAWRLLEALVEAGHATRVAQGAARRPSVYRLADGDQPARCPDVVAKWTRSSDG